MSTAGWICFPCLLYVFVWTELNWALSARSHSKLMIMWPPEQLWPSTTTECLCQWPCCDPWTGSVGPTDFRYTTEVCIHEAQCTEKAALPINNKKFHFFAAAFFVTTSSQNTNKQTRIALCRETSIDQNTAVNYNYMTENMWLLKWSVMRALQLQLLEQKGVSCSWLHCLEQACQT